MKNRYALSAFLMLSAMGGHAQFTLQVLHASDLEGGVNAIGRAPNFAAIIDALEEEQPNTIILSAGDNYIPGPFFSASGDPTMRPVLREVYDVVYGGVTPNNLREDVGRTDITIMNVVGFDASALGNHEFDAGTNIIQSIIGPQFSGTEVRWMGSQFPYLSANLDVSADGALSGLAVNTIEENTFFTSNPNTLQPGEKKSIAKGTYIVRNGETIGVVGATTPLLGSISSPGATTVLQPGAGSNDMAALATHIQPVIDEMLLQGVNKIILVSHLQQVQLEQELAALLNGVDIIVAGGSDAVLANDAGALWPFDQGNVFGPYPLVTSNADGDPCLIVSTNGEYSYVGRLVVDFDANGVLDPASIDAAESGPYRTAIDVVEALHGDSATAFTEGTKGELVQRLVNAVQDVVIAKDANIMGRSTVYLDGRRSQVRTQETNLGNITADANLWVARQFDASTAVSLKNGGGIRAQIGEVVETSPGVYEFLPPQANPLSGKLETEVSQLDIENSLRFNNLLSLVTLSAEGLKAVVEHGISGWAPGATPGAFPQVGGARFSFDPAQPAGSRIVSLALFDDEGMLTDSVVYQGAIVGDPDRPIRVVTLNFLAGGGDGYPFAVLGEDRVDLDTVLTAPGAATFAVPGSEQDALSEFLQTFHAAGAPYAFPETEIEQDERIQVLSFRDDTVYPLNTVVENRSEAAWTVFPNPASSVLNLVSGEPVIEVMVLSITGQVMTQEVGPVRSLDVGQLAAGTYVLQVRTQDGLSVARVVIAR